MGSSKSLDDYPDILTAALVAEMLDMNLDYVRKLSREGKIPAHKMPAGRAFRYFKDEITEWLRALPATETTVNEQSSTG